MGVLMTIIQVILCVFSIFLIAVVLLQSGQNKSSGAVGGGAEAIVGKKKARGMDAKLARLTKIVAIAFMILALVLVIIQRFAA